MWDLAVGSDSNNVPFPVQLLQAIEQDGRSDCFKALYLCQQVHSSVDLLCPHRTAVFNQRLCKDNMGNAQ